MIGTLYRTILIMTAVMTLFSCLNKKDKVINHTNGIDNIAFKKFIENRPYTILYIWTSWCGISRNGLINDYYESYNTINNDTIQSLLIITSDTNTIKDFFLENKFSLPYKYLYPDKYLPLIRNFNDEKKKDQFTKEYFNYECQFPGFPSVLLINNKSEVLMESSDVKHAISNYRYFEKQKIEKTD